MHDGSENSDDVELSSQPRKPRKGIYVLPNLFTLAALFGGFYAIVMAMNGRFDMAAIGVFCAMVLDSLDGRVARMTNTQSAFGEQMDSLSDMVSFGAAPALIAYEWSLKGLGRWGWIAAFVYCACAALRLARFNVNTAVVDKRFFQGLPSPAAAALVMGFISIMTDAEISPSSMAWPMFVVALFSGLTMLCSLLWALPWSTFTRPSSYSVCLSSMASVVMPCTFGAALRASPPASSAPPPKTPTSAGFTSNDLF